MTDQLLALTLGLELTPFAEVQDYVAEHVEHDGRSLLQAWRHWRLLDPKHVEAIRRFHKNDADFPAFLQELKLRDIRKLDTALEEGLRSWAHDGRLLVFARDRRTGRFGLPPKSLWVFAEIDLESGAIRFDGETRFETPQFLLAEHVPDGHTILAHLAAGNDPAMARRPDDETSGQSGARTAHLQTSCRGQSSHAGRKAARLPQASIRS